MTPILCFCAECRRHRATRRALVQSRRKRWRSRTRWLLRTGRYDELVTSFYVGYTDWPLYSRCGKSEAITP